MCAKVKCECIDLPMFVTCLPCIVLDEINCDSEVSCMRCDLMVWKTLLCYLEKKKKVVESVFVFHDVHFLKHLGIKEFFRHGFLSLSVLSSKPSKLNRFN